jgi:hypothetical protein
MRVRRTNKMTSKGKWLRINSEGVYIDPAEEPEKDEELIVIGGIPVIAPKRYTDENEENHKR